VSSTGSGRGVRLKAVAVKTALHKNIGPAEWLAGGNGDGMANTNG